MRKHELFAWVVVFCSLAALAWGAALDPQIPSLSTIAFWTVAAIAAELLPVSLGFQTRVTMSFPILLAVALLFDPLPAMVIAGLAAFDMRELRLDIPLWRALFNRSQGLLAVGASELFVMPLRPDPQRLDQVFSFPLGTVAIALAAGTYVLVNLGLVGNMMHLHLGISRREALRSLVPHPVGGFWLSQVVLAAFGAATAAAYDRIGAFVAVFLIPLLFARLSILGARAQQELAERVRKQQEALLEATERVFQEREDERHRIAEDIHDGSLQLLAAASYGYGNANEFLKAGRPDKAEDAMVGAREAVDAAIKALRESLVDLRRSSVEQGGLMETVQRFAGQVSVLWGTEVVIEGQIMNEPPIPVALAAFQILQEGLTNAMKHARGGSVTVRIGDADGMVHIVVEDKGPGFDPEIEVGSEHVGMRLMRERAERVGGRIELDTSPSTGTRLEAILPGGVAQ
jgi:signal transduction histidine kinase